jgi:hypothetical protein
MNKIIALLILCALGYFSYKPVVAFADRSRYSLSQIESKPIPRRAALTLWQDVALENCGEAQSLHNISPEQCREIVNKRHESCSASSAGTVPETIAQSGQLRALGRAYLGCATPYYFCNGVEVRSEQEVKAQCKR